MDTRSTNELCSTKAEVAQHPQPMLDWQRAKPSRVCLRWRRRAGGGRQLPGREQDSRTCILKLVCTVPIDYIAPKAKLEPRERKKAPGFGPVRTCSCAISRRSAIVDHNDKMWRNRSDRFLRTDWHVTPCHRCAVAGLRRQQHWAAALPRQLWLNFLTYHDEYVNRSCAWKSMDVGELAACRRRFPAGWDESPAGTSQPATRRRVTLQCLPEGVSSHLLSIPG